MALLRVGLQRPTKSCGRRTLGKFARGFESFESPYASVSIRGAMWVSDFSRTSKDLDVATVSDRRVLWFCTFSTQSSEPKTHCEGLVIPALTTTAWSIEEALCFPLNTLTLELTSIPAPTTCGSHHGVDVAVELKSEIAVLENLCTP
jgi:hypothetical protein